MAPAHGTRAPWIITGLSLVLVAGFVVAAALVPAPGSDGSDAPRTAGRGSAMAVDASASDASATSPTPVGASGAPENATAYDVRALGQIDVWTVNPALPVDDDPFGALTGELATPLADAPIFADPTGAPIGYLAHDASYGGSTVPVVTRDTNWVKVLLAGRQGVPPDGNAGQAVGWLRVADVALTRTEAYVEVHLEDHTIDIVTAARSERVASDFSWGKPTTPTPVGRTFVMLTRVVPEFAYTQGHPLVYLGVQSPAMAGFDGGEVAVTAFHYYRVRSGPNSFGCIYLDGAATDRLAELPAGTPVVIQH